MCEKIERPIASEKSNEKSGNVAVNDEWCAWNGMWVMMDGADDAGMEKRVWKNLVETIEIACVME